MKNVVINTRYESKAQVDRFKKAARIRRWSLNTFILAACEEMADKVLGTKEKPEKAAEEVADGNRQAASF